MVLKTALNAAYEECTNAENNGDNEDAFEDVDMSVGDFGDAALPSDGDSVEFDRAAAYNIIIENIRKLYPSLSKEQKVAVIQVLPDVWNIPQIVERIGASERLVRDVKNGEVTFERKIHKNRLSEENKQKVIDFYLDPRISRVLAGNSTSLYGL